MHTNGIKANIARVLSQASLGEYHDGAQWYSHAKTIAQDIASNCGIELDKVADVIAALSPNCAWPQNIADAWKVCKAWHSVKTDIQAAVFDISVSNVLQSVKVTTYTRNRDKAFRILAGEDVLSGRKVTAFAANIKGDLQAVTIDTHALSIAYAQRFTVRTCPNISPSEFRQIGKAYQLVARDNDIAPAKCQAITWRTWRRIHGLTRASELTSRLF